MLKSALLFSSLLCALTGVASAGSIATLEIDLGDWTGSSFNISNHRWNTYPSGWAAIGLSNPTLGSPLLNTSSSSDMGLSDGSYYLFMSDYGNSYQAIQFIVTYEGGATNTVVFTDPSGAVNADGYTLVSGTGVSASLLSPAQSTYELVGGNAQTYAPNGFQNWIVAFNSVGGATAAPEPSSWLLFAIGAVGLWVLSRRRSRPVA